MNKPKCKLERLRKIVVKKALEGEKRWCLVSPDKNIIGDSNVKI